MHEAGIAASLLEMAEEEARRHGSPAIVRVKVRVGDFSNVVPEALEFAFEALKGETLAARAVLEMERVQVVARCAGCAQRVQPEASLVLWCPQCGGPLEVLEGQDLQLEFVDLEEACSGSPSKPAS